MRYPISITVERDNLVWLKAQAAARTRGNVSEIVDRLIAEARAAGQTDPAAVKSVVGTVDLPDDDSLADADAYVRTMFERSLSRPMLVKDRPPRRPGRRG